MAPSTVILSGFAASASTVPLTATLPIHGSRRAASRGQHGRWPWRCASAPPPFSAADFAPSRCFRFRAISAPMMRRLQMWSARASGRGFRLRRGRSQQPIGAVVVSASGMCWPKPATCTLQLHDDRACRAPRRSRGLHQAWQRSGSSTAISTSRSSLAPCALRQFSFARLRRLYFARPRSKGGAVEHGPRLRAANLPSARLRSMAASARHALRKALLRRPPLKFKS